MKIGDFLFIFFKIFIINEIYARIRYMSIWNKMFGDESSKFIGSTKDTISKINALEADISKLSDLDFPKKTQEFKDRLKKGESLEDILPEAYALVREAAKRNLGERHYDVQMIGGLALHYGKIAEMRTGEGKTLVATLPLYLNALSDKGDEKINNKKQEEIQL